MDFSLFMKANKKTLSNKKYAPTASLCDKDGKPLEWEFKPLTSAEVNDIRDTCMVQVPIEGKKGSYTTTVDYTEYVNKVIVESTVFPDLYNKSLQDSYGVNTPIKLMLAMVDHPGEYNDLAEFVMDMQNSNETFDSLVVKAKN